MGAGSSSKRCVNLSCGSFFRYSVLHLGVSVPRVWHTDSLSSQGVSQKPSDSLNHHSPMQMSQSLMPWALDTNDWIPCHALQQAGQCTTVSLSCRFSASRLGSSGSGEGRWSLCTLKSLSGVLFCTTAESSVHSSSGDLIHNMYLPMCDRSQAALYGRVSRMDHPYVLPCQACFFQELFLPPPLDLL